MYYSKHSEYIFNFLMNDYNIKRIKGSVEIILGDVSQRYKKRDAVGELLQAWFAKCLQKNNIYFREKENTQAFPDFLLSESDKDHFLELKTFNYEASPAFDIANFDSYCDSLLKNPERLNSDYLIFGYNMDLDSGDLTIKDIWLKKIWELSSPDGSHPLNIQVKRGTIYNLRPYNFKSDRSNCFNSRKQFVNALNDAIVKFPNQTSSYSENWLNKVEELFFSKTGEKI